MIAKSVTPKEAGGRKAVRRSAGVEGRSGAGGVSIAARARAPKDHRLKSRPRDHECAALRGAVVDSPALSSVQAQNVRRTSAREKVCCLPTRMMAIVSDRAVPRGEVADPGVCPPRLGGQCKTSPRIHNYRSKHWHYAHQVSSLKCARALRVQGPRKERCPHSYPSRAPCGGAAGQLRASAREAVKGFIPRKMETPRLA